MATESDTHQEDGHIAVGAMDIEHAPSMRAVIDPSNGQVTSDEATKRRDVGGKYAPQFITTSSLILRRIRDTGEALNMTNKSTSNMIQSQDGTAKRTESANLWTMPLPNANSQSSLDPSPATHHEQIASISSGLKRKRNPESEAPDFTQTTISFPTSMVSNMAPSRRPAAVSDGPGRAFGSSQAPTSHSAQAAVNTIRDKRLSSISDGILPAKAELVGFYAGQALDITRTQYFLEKRRTDLLNILSFCDQLRPQLLADILVSVSKRHPDLPVFDSPDWEQTVSRSLGYKISATVRVARPVGRPRHGHTVLNPKARQRQKNAKKALKRLIMAQNEDDAPEDEEDVEEDVLPPTWPKAGEGLYAKLLPETEDRTFLADENDGESFSQFMVDNFGKPMVVPTCA